MVGCRAKDGANGSRGADTSEAGEAGTARADGPPPSASDNGSACASEWTQGGGGDVDVLLVIDNADSMAEEQKKLSQALPGFLTALVGAEGEASAPGSVHIGVVSADLGVNLAPPSDGCGSKAFNPTAPDPANPAPAVRMSAPNAERLDKPFGDNGVLQTSTEVAQAGIWARPSGTTFSTPVELLAEPDPRCAEIELPQRYVEFDAASSDLNQTSLELGCIAKLGRNGCDRRQPLESMHKALAPTTEVFSRNTRGQGEGAGAANSGFLRDDATLAVVIVTDRDDCSIPDQSSELFNRNSPSFQPGDLDSRCGKPENQHHLREVRPYLDGLRSLKPEQYRDRLVFAVIAGLPLAVNLSGQRTHSGKDEIDAILAREDMQFAVRPKSTAAQEEEPVPACQSPVGEGGAAPARRLLQVASEFSDNAVVSSICETEFDTALEAVAAEISQRRRGPCLSDALPRADDEVECELVEIMPSGADDACDPARGREPVPARNVDGISRRACRVDQLAVKDGDVARGSGWYYDDFSDGVRSECRAAPRRIAFAPGAEPAPDVQFRLECPSRPKASLDTQAIGSPCASEESCFRFNQDYFLICVSAGCQIRCLESKHCPGMVECVSDSASGTKYCLNPRLCPFSWSPRRP